MCLLMQVTAVQEDQSKQGRELAVFLFRQYAEIRANGKVAPKVGALKIKKRPLAATCHLHGLSARPFAASLPPA